MNDLKDKVILITGGGQGLGAAISQIFASSGATVIPADIKEEQVQLVAREIESKGGKAKPLVLNVMDETAIQQTVEEIIQEFGRIDVLINNAGTDVTKSIEELTIPEWDRVIDVNLKGPFLLSKAVFPHMVKQGKGHIVNIASTAAKRTWPNASAYHASKWGLLGFSHALHAEARLQQIKVTAVVAGGMRTPFILERFPDVDPNTLQDPKNVAETIKFVLMQPNETVIPEVMVIPMRETSWP